jgi:tRNA-dihydrouridine synthase
MAVGHILDPRQAEAILTEGHADLTAIGRQAMYDPYWPHHAAQALGADPDFRSGTTRQDGGLPSVAAASRRWASVLMVDPFRSRTRQRGSRTESLAPRSQQPSPPAY